jgi:hypothetical protein
MASVKWYVVFPLSSVSHSKKPDPGTTAFQLVAEDGLCRGRLRAEGGVEPDERSNPRWTSGPIPLERNRVRSSRNVPPAPG